MADDRYYGDVLETHSLTHFSEFKLVETNNISSSIFTTKQRESEAILVFISDAEEPNSELLLYPQDIVELHRSHDFEEFVERDDVLPPLFHPTSNQISSYAKCAYCGDNLDPNKAESYYIFNLDRALIFQPSCLDALVQNLAQYVEDNSSRILSWTI